jgi:hypothetical protein
LTDAVFFSAYLQNHFVFVLLAVLGNWNISIMEIPKRIIEDVAAKMLDNQIVMEDISVVPNVYVIYLHTTDFSAIKHSFPRLRPQIEKRLNKEIAKRTPKSGQNKNRLLNIIKIFTGLEVFGESLELVVPDVWDITFKETDREVLVGDETFSIQKGEFCVVSSFSEPKNQQNQLASHLKTFVTVFKSDETKTESVVVEKAKSTKNPYQTNVDHASKPTAAFFPTNALAVLKCKYKKSGVEETFEMNKDHISIGRETTNDFVLLHASDHISRKHLEITFKNDQFFLKSFGIYGTTLQGKLVPPSEKVVDNTTQNLNKEVEIPTPARIALAGGEILITFQRMVP